MVLFVLWWFGIARVIRFEGSRSLARSGSRVRDRLRDPVRRFGIACAIRFEGSGSFARSGSKVRDRLRDPVPRNEFGTPFSREGSIPLKGAKTYRLPGRQLVRRI